MVTDNDESKKCARPATRNGEEMSTKASVVPDSFTVLSRFRRVLCAYFLSHCTQCLESGSTGTRIIPLSIDGREREESRTLYTANPGDFSNFVI